MIEVLDLLHIDVLYWSNRVMIQKKIALNFSVYTWHIEFLVGYAYEKKRMGSWWMSHAFQSSDEFVIL